MFPSMNEGNASMIYANNKTKSSLFEDRILLLYFTFNFLVITFENESISRCFSVLMSANLHVFVGNNSRNASHCELFRTICFHGFHISTMLLTNAVQTK